MNNKHISIKVSGNSISELDEIAKKQDHSRSQLIRIAIKSFIENYGK